MPPRPTIASQFWEALKILPLIIIAVIIAPAVSRAENHD